MRHFICEGKSLFVGIGLLFVTVSTSSGQMLQADVTLDTTQRPLWNYTLINNEPSVSSNWVTSFFLPIAAPVTNIVAPNNWTVDTDNETYILWSNIEAPPYPHDISPGASLSGFQFESDAPMLLVESTITSWDHSIDDAGPIVSKSIYAPGIVPAPSSLMLMLIGCLPLVWRRIRSQRSLPD